ncbi:LapA family protein [Streptomyces sp. NPDC053431]|uniref:LapA family protein n=1 Tax=Streptomyces sp. NPDC053431 TaxID=3365703 RepID=UPI0037D7D577
MSRQDASGRRPAASGTDRRARAPLVLVLAIAVLCGAVAAGVLWNAGARADRELAAHRHRVQATTTGRAHDSPVAVRPGAKPQPVAPAVWAYPDNVRRSGTVQVPPRTPQGHTLIIWVDDHGSPARPPGSTADRALTAIAGSTTVASAAAASGAGVLALVRRRSEGRRLAAWEREWEQVEPVWSGRLRRGTGGTGDE